jgi:hypothetical protein
MRPALIVRALLFTVCLSPATFPHKGYSRTKSDYDIYLETIRNMRMSEVAHSDLEMAANVVSGRIQLVFRKNERSQVYGTGFENLTCPSPTLTAAQRESLDATDRKIIEHDIESLRARADTDGSGFVSTEEAETFREMVEFGLRAAHVAQQESTFAKTARGLGMSVPELSATARSYEAYRARFLLSPPGGGTFAPLPAMLLEPVEQRGEKQLSFSHRR